MAKADHTGQPSRIRRNVQRYGDPYIPKGTQGEIAVCARCQAISISAVTGSNET